MVGVGAILKTMNIIEACEEIFKNRNLYAKRKCWENKMIKIHQVGWASQYERTAEDDVKKLDPTDNYIELIKDNRLCGGAIPDLDDILANDWIVFSK